MFYENSFRFSTLANISFTNFDFINTAMSGKPWSGEQELQTVLQELCGHKSNVPSSKIRQVVSIANKYVTDFKMVVYEIEKFIKKSANEDKMSGLFVLDSLCRQHSKDRETFAKRFGIRLKETISYFYKVSNEEKVRLPNQTKQRIPLTIYQLGNNQTNC